MARPRDFLARFRPVGTPGPAAPAGVPADRAAELALELGPVLASLADTQVEAAAIRSAGEVEATRVRHEGRTRAEDLVVAAGTEAQSERVRTLARARQEADGAVVRTMAGANAEAAAIEARVAQRLPEFVQRVETAARADLFCDSAPAAVQPEGSR